MWEQLVRLEVYHFLYAFARVGSAFLAMPFLSSNFIPVKIRLLFTIAFSVLLTPLMVDKMPAPPTTALELARQLCGEVTVGVFMGMMPAIFMVAIDLVGINAAMATSFSNATVLDPQSSMQTTVLSSFLSLIAVMTIVATNLHHLMIGAVLDSYDLFAVGASLMTEDMKEFVAKILSLSFLCGFKIGAPFILMIVVLYTSMGIMSRLMPQLNIMFVIMPLQVYLGLALIMMSLPMIIWWFVSFVDDQMALWLAGGG